MKNEILEVALVKEACPLCAALQDGPIVMNTRLTKNEAAKVKELHGKTIGYMDKPCDKCQKMMSVGILLIECDEEKTEDEKNPYRTGRQFVITEEAAQRIFNDDRIIKKRSGFITSEVTTMLGLDQIEPTHKTLD